MKYLRVTYTISFRIFTPNFRDISWSGSSYSYLPYSFTVTNLLKSGGYRPKRAQRLVDMAEGVILSPEIFAK